MSSLESIAKSKLVETLIQDMSIDEKWRDDLAGEIYLALCEMPEEKIDKLVNTGQIRFFLSRIIMNQMFSSTSPFYTKYRKFGLSCDEFKMPEDNEEDDYDE